MKRLILIVAMVLVAREAHGQRISRSISFGATPPPATFYFALATPDNQQLGLTIPNIPAGPYTGRNPFWIITEANAADYGMDWNAWANALVDPASPWDRTVATLNEVPEADPFGKNIFDKTWESFQLAEIDIAVLHYSFLGSHFDGASFITNIRDRRDIVPEPATSVLILVGACVTLVRRSRS